MWRASTLSSRRGTKFLAESSPPVVANVPSPNGPWRLMTNPFDFRFLPLTAAAVLIGTALAGAPAQAQLFNRPPAAVPEADDGYEVRGADPAQTMVRMDRLENQIRSLNGRIEQLEFANKRLEDALQKFQRDVDFRFQDSGGGRVGGGAPIPAGAPAARPGKRSDLDPAAGQDYAAALPAGGEPTVIDAPGGSRRSRGDAFDPSMAPTAPGAPRELGQIPQSQVPQSQVASTDPAFASRQDPNAPLDLRAPAARQGGAAPVAPMPPSVPRESSLGARPIGLTPRGEASAMPVQPVQNPTVLPGAGPMPPSNAARTTPGGTVLAGLPPAGTPKEEFDLALVSFNNGQFEAAETGFRGFLDKHPKDKLTPDAVFYLGDSYWKRGRAREAAEQYLKVSTDYSKSAKAPEALVKLGLALERLGAKEQACATWGEVGRKYPSASVAVRNGAEREAKRLSC